MNNKKVVNGIIKSVVFIALANFLIGTVASGIVSSNAFVLTGMAQQSANPNNTQFATKNTTSSPSSLATPPPSVVHLRVQIANIQVYNDRDSPIRADGEWQLQGIVTCCGTAANSNMPTNVYSFNAPGATEGQIDTPDNLMNDVRGTRGGNWGTVEIVKFPSVYQDFDIDNTNPLSQLNIDFFGIEDDRISPSDLPPLPDNTGNAYVEAAKYAEKVIVYVNNLKGVDHLGSVHDEFTKAANYGVGEHYATSSRTYRNVNYESESQKNFCAGQEFPANFPQCKLKDWPDFPEYIINYRIIDRDGPRCALGFTYNYMTNTCEGDIIT